MSKHHGEDGEVVADLGDGVAPTPLLVEEASSNSCDGSEECTPKLGNGVVGPAIGWCCQSDTKANEGPVGPKQATSDLVEEMPKGQLVHI